MGQCVHLKSKFDDLSHDLTFYAHTIDYVCHSIRSMFRVLGMYNFDILKTFTQVTTRLKNFLVGWSLVLGLKEGLVECATVRIKSCVILKSY